MADKQALGVQSQVLERVSTHLLDRLLKRWQLDLRALGVSLEGVDLDAVSFRRSILDAIWRAEQPPRELVGALVDLSALATDTGATVLGKAAEELKTPLPVDARSVSLHDQVVVAYLDYPEVFRLARGQTTSHSPRRFHEFRAESSLAVTAEQVMEATAAVQQELSQWCAANNRTDACWVEAHPDDHRLHIAVIHGRPRRTVTTITDSKSRGRQSFVPDKEDTMILDVQTGMLSVNATYPNEIAAYRRAWGRQLYGDAECFQPADAYTCEPLRTEGVRALSAEGVDRLRSVAIRELVLTDREFGCSWRWVGKKQHMSVALQRHFWQEILSCCRVDTAKFVLRTDDRPQGFTVEMVPPNKLAFDRRFETVVRAFLRRRGFAREASARRVSG